MEVLEAISKATVLKAEDAVTAKLVEFFRLCADRDGTSPYLNEMACRKIAEGSVRITLGYLQSGLDAAEAAVHRSSREGTDG